MQPGERWEPSDLVQIRKNVEGQGDIGVVLGDATGWGPGCLSVLFSEGVRAVHVTNLQKPDGRTRRRP